MPGPLVGDADPRAGPVTRDEQPHGRSTRGVADRVVDQDGHDLLEPIRVAVDDHRLALERDLDPALLGETGEPAQRVTGHVGEVQPLRPHLHGARVGARQQEQLVDEPRHPLPLRTDVLHRARHRRIVERGLATKIVGAAADDGDRRAQLV